MTAVTCEEEEISLAPARRISSEKPAPRAKAKKLRIIQVGSYPTVNRGARANLLTIHERLQARGHESVVIDMTPYHHAKQPGVFYPRSIFELGRMLLEIPADVIHLQIGSALTIPKIALAAIVNKLPEAKKICTLHLGGHFNPKQTLRAWRYGATAAIFRQFDSLIAINPEVASFFERIGVNANRLQLITPFPRLRVAESVTLSNEIETFCRQHTPLIASVGEFEPGYDLPQQFDILNRVRERYPSAGLIAIGSGALHFKFACERALHRDCNHIEMTGELPEAAASELIHRANVLLHTNEKDRNSFAVREALKSKTPVVNTNNGAGDVEASSLEVLRSLQIARPQYEDAPAALSDGVDDVIRLYKQLVAAKRDEPRPLPAGYEWPSMGWGL